MEQKVIEAFLHNHLLKFSEIEKQTKIRSNKLTYYLKKLAEKNVLEKKGDKYQLTETSEYIIPYLSNKQAVLPAVIISLTKNDKIFLAKRLKRPYQNLYGLPGGRIKLGETIKQTTERIMKEKFNIKASFKKINSLSLEQVKKKNKIIHSFLLIFVTATTKDKLEYFDIKKMKNEIIKSDYKIILNDSDKNVKVENIISRV